jgi:S1-C subfamily serine protease
LGVTHCNLTERVVINRYWITIDSSIQEGIVILSTVEGSGAEQAGLKSGDVIIKIDDDKILNSAYLKYVLFKHSFGETVTVTYIRGNETKTAKVTLIKSEQ